MLVGALSNRIELLHHCRDGLGNIQNRPAIIIIAAQEHLIEVVMGIEHARQDRLAYSINSLTRINIACRHIADSNNFAALKCNVPKGEHAPLRINGDDVSVLD